MSSNPTALRVTGLAKSFGATQALRYVDVEVAQGTVHALLGGNGSGKSTLVKILAGVYQADAGTIELGDQQFPAADFKAADGARHGLRFVHQDLGLIETSTIAENMAFARGFPTRLRGQISWRRLRAETAELLARYEIDAGPQTPVERLRPADRTMVAIARALGMGAEHADSGAQPVLVLDEPTASLPRHESEVLLAAVRRRAAAGQTVVLISHHLGEVLDVADEITVLRDGRTAGRLRAADADEDAVVSLIAGRAVTALGRAQPDPVERRPVLRVRDLAAGPLTGVDLEVGAGEIVGVTGLLGSGRTALLNAVFGVRERRAGRVDVDGHVLGDGGPSEAMAAGVALVPEDRAGDAAFPDDSVSDNLAAAVWPTYWRGGIMRRGAQRRDARGLIDRFGVRTDGPQASLSSLSGGNQQKAILARWLRRDPRVLLLDEPTQGVDVVSRADIYRLVREAAAGGCAVLVASSDADELAILCDRVLVLGGGRLAAEVTGDDVTAESLNRLVQTATGTTAAASTAVGANP